MKKTLIFILFVCFSMSIFAQNRPRLAILPITGGTGGDGETIAELFSFEPEIQRVFIPIPRTSSIQAIMKEQQFQASTGLTDSDTIARLGKQANADYVVAGHIQVLGNSRLVLITIVHVESLQQIAGDYRQYTNIEEIQAIIPDMARRIAQSAQIIPRLAVLPFAVSSQGVNQRDAEVLAQLLATEVANSGKYAVLPRTSQIQAVMKEHEIQRSGLTEENSIRRIGQALNAQYVLAGNVRRLGQSNMFTAQILEVETASLLKGSAENYSSVADGLTIMASLSTKLTGGSAPVPINTTSAQMTTNANTSAGNVSLVSTSSGNVAAGNILTANAGWFSRTDGGNADVKEDSEAKISFARETIQNRAVDVMTLYVNLARGKVWRMGQFSIYNDSLSESFINRIKTANGIKFSVLGDGVAGWKMLILLTNVFDYCWHEASFTTKKGQVTQVDIPFSKLKQPDWGRKVNFNKINIKGIEIQRMSGDGSSLSGASTIKIFDFDIY